MQFLADLRAVNSVTACGSNRPCWRSAIAGSRSTRCWTATVREALTFFSQSPKVLRRLQVLDEIGLGYPRLGQ